MLEMCEGCDSKPVECFVCGHCSLCCECSCEDDEGK